MKQFIFLALALVILAGCGDPLGATTRTQISAQSAQSIASTQSQAALASAQADANARIAEANAESLARMEAARVEAQAREKAAEAQARADVEAAQADKEARIASAQADKEARETIAREDRQKVEIWAATLPFLIILTGIVLMGGIWLWWGGRSHYEMTRARGTIAIEERRRAALVDYAQRTGATIQPGRDGSYLLQFPDGQERLYLPKPQGANHA